MTQTDNITVTTTVAVDAATAFEIFTDEIGEWWVHRPGQRPGSLRFEGGASGRLIERSAEGELEIGRVLAWEPARRLVFEWRPRGFEPGQRTEVEVRFDADANGTRITLEHRGWDAIPDGHPARFGWTGTAFTSLIGLWWADLLVGVKGRSAPQHPRAPEPASADSAHPS